MNVVLISTYELGRQPFGLASPAAWLKEAGATVNCLDLAVQPLAPEKIVAADLVAFYLPMHTATRIAISVLRRVRTLNPDANLCCFGLYAPLNAGLLRKLGVTTILGGEFEEGLVSLYKRLSENQSGDQTEPVVSLSRQQFLVPDRSGLPKLDRYAHLVLAEGEQRLVGYTEASRGCKHRCRHCPVVPVYGGRFRIVPREVVLEDIRRQIEMGAEHITFGDPDFFNGPGHAIRLVESLHEQFPNLTYDVTIKIEHLLRHSKLLPTLRDTGCLFVTSAVEAIDDNILELLDKDHSREDFVRIAALLQQVGLTFNPTFVPFTPWTSIEGYQDLMTMVMERDLVDNVAPIQYAIRLLIPSGSRLLELDGVRALLGGFDEMALAYRWSSPDPRVDRLCNDVMAAVKEGQARGESRRLIFQAIWELTKQATHTEAKPLEPSFSVAARPVPYLSEDWFC